METMIKKITINGFRSIDNITLSCFDANIFSGINDSGKSNVLKALNLFFNSQTDFQKPLKFDEDYNKISLARATMSAKMKQQIKIRVHLKVPRSYESLNTENDVYLERAYDRFGNRTEKYSSDKKRAQITRLINTIRFIYIPALKGESVLQYLLALIGEYELIEPGDIETINKKINKKTEDLSTLLEESKIPINTAFGLPTLLADFWQKLAVETQFDGFDFVNKNIKSKKDPSKKINPNLLKIPLILRGEGIKSKYIPPLLMWLNNKNIRSTYIWAIDEPENSLEFGLASELANLYFNDYALKSQIFLTSHSLAFINPPDDVKASFKIYRCIKDNQSSTQIKSFDDLFKEQNKFELFDEIGALEVQKSLIEDYRKIRRSQAELFTTIEKLKKPIVLTEGKTDVRIIASAWEKLYPTEEMPFEILSAGIEVNEDDRNGGADQVRRSLELSANFSKSQTMIGIFDNDREGNEQVKGFNNKSFEPYNIIKNSRKHKTKNIYGVLIPCPSQRVMFVSKTSISQRFLQIEHYFTDVILKKNNLMGDKILNTEVFEIRQGAKSDFAQNVVNLLDTSEFQNFRLLFDLLRSIIVVPNKLAAEAMQAK